MRSYAMSFRSNFLKLANLCEKKKEISPHIALLNRNILWDTKGRMVLTN